MKLSEQAIKVSNPGILQVRRYYDDGQPAFLTTRGERATVCHCLEQAVPEPEVTSGTVCSKQWHTVVRNAGAVGDMIFDAEFPPGDGETLVDPLDATRRKIIPHNTRSDDLLAPLFRGGEQVYESPTLEAMRSRLQEQLAMFHAGVKRFVNPHEYPVGLELGLHERKTDLILKARGFPSE